MYLVRHGETEGNVARIHQDEHTRLTDIGIDQARFVAHRFTKLSIDAIYSSDYDRAVHTATIISERIGLKVEITPLLREVKRPTLIEGKTHFDPISEEVRDVIAKHQHEPDWHHSDEENYFDLKKRALQCLSHFSSLKTHSVIAVTHGNYAKLLLATVVFGKRVTPRMFDRFSRSFALKNTGINVLESRDGRWHIVTWNDHAHLG